MGPVWLTTHTLQLWEDAGDTSCPIPFPHQLRALGKEGTHTLEFGVGWGGLWGTGKQKQHTVQGSTEGRPVHSKDGDCFVYV